MTDKAKTETVKKVWLANKTVRPVHIMQRGKDADGNNLGNIRLSTMGAVEVSEDLLKLSGVAQLMKNKVLVKVTEAEAKKLNKAHDAVVSQPEPMDDEEED